ncbi:MAG: OB-fold nucleic acid binding domain-containing protein, partial [Candidatus Hinthialibacter sp.]
MNFQKRSPCGQLDLSHVDQEVQVVGWVDALRDHGVVLFVHVRDRSGIVQVVFSPDVAPEVCEQAGALKTEYCIAVEGRVVEREKGTENPSLETGQIEIMATRLTILSASKSLPFSISEKAMISGASVASAGGT